jgi:hypothetical protein
MYVEAHGALAGGIFHYIECDGALDLESAVEPGGRDLQTVAVAGRRHT